MDDALLHKDVTAQVLGGFFEVHVELGGGFLEPVYRLPMIEVLRDRGLQVEDNAQLPVYFRGKRIAQFHPDLVVNQLVVVELKAFTSIERAHEAQVLNYLKASDMEVGLLLNFGPTPQFRRYVFANARKRCFLGTPSKP